MMINSASRVSHPPGSGRDTRGRAHLTVRVIFIPLLKNIPLVKASCTAEAKIRLMAQDMDTETGELGWSL